MCWQASVDVENMTIKLLQQDQVPHVFTSRSGSSVMRGVACQGEAGIMYKSCTNMDAIEALGASPLLKLFADIDTVVDKPSLTDYLVLDRLARGLFSRAAEEVVRIVGRHCGGERRARGGGDPAAPVRLAGQDWASWED